MSKKEESQKIDNSEKEKEEIEEEPNRVYSKEELNDYHKLIYPWQQHLDPKWNKYFFFNPFTNESVWELPKAIQSKVNIYYENLRQKENELKLRNMDEYVEKIDDKIEESRKLRAFDWMSRPARKQVETPLSARFAYKQGDEVYNIWYDKFLSDDKFKEREQAITKIDPELDTGYTKADIYGKKQGYFCIHFARGCCVEGHRCRYYHHIPTLDECLSLDQIKDIFGRTRFANQREDREGVGSFMKETRTLRVSDFCMCTGDGDNVAATYEVLWRHFGCLGELEDIHLIPERCIAYVRYAHRAMAEFAKEAMSNQPLENNEIMIVRWADSDIIGLNAEGAEKSFKSKNKKENEDENSIENRKTKNGRLRKKKRTKDEESNNPFEQELAEVKVKEDLLGKRLNSEREFSFVEQRLDQIRKNAQVMDSVLKRLNTNKEAGGASRTKKKLDLDSYFKKFNESKIQQSSQQGRMGPQVSTITSMNPLTNDAPLF